MGRRKVEMTVTSETAGPAIEEPLLDEAPVATEDLPVETETAPSIATTREGRNLKIHLTHEELLEQGAILAAQTQEVAHLEAEMKSMRDSMKAGISKAQAAAGAASRLISDGYRYGMVKCEVVRNYTEGTYTASRLDTGEVIESRRLRDEEQQVKMQLDPVQAEE